MTGRKQKAIPPTEQHTADVGPAHPQPGANATAGRESLQLTVMDSLDVQQLLHISRSTLYNCRQNGLLSFCKVGGRIYFEVADVYRMLKERKQDKCRAAA